MQAIFSIKDNDMSFFKAINDYSHGSINETVAEDFRNELKDLEKFFDEKYEDGDEFATLFFDKFENLFNKYGFSDGSHEGLIETLYFHVDEFKYLATHMTIVGRNVTQSEYADHVYEDMMIEMQQQFEDDE